jgi:predicted ATPase
MIAALRKDPRDVPFPDPKSSLPASPTALIGRRREQAEVAAILDEDHVRLVTLTGPGGTGKTRLALAVAEAAAGRYEDGAHFVDLSAVADPGLVSATIARALDVAEEPGKTPVEVVTAELRDRRLLLVLDNFEQVLDAAPAVAELLRGVRRLEVLVTSRAPLRVAGEQTYHVAPLPLPDHQLTRDPAALERNEAVQLFVSRAREVSPGFELTRANAEDVVNVCLDLDGLPLALELAAARTAVLSADALAGRIGSRLELLTGGRRDAPDRQQTLRAAIDWSVGLLDPAGQELLARLSVFAGSFTAQAAEEVCDASLDGLASLVEYSLLRRSPGDESRLGMLETIREYAAERLDGEGDAESVRRRHARYYLALAEQGVRVIHGGDQALWWRRVEDDHGNLRAALGWAEATGDIELELELGNALWSFWLVYGYATEGRARFDSMLARADGASEPARAAALHGAGALAYRLGDFASAREHFERSLELHRKLGDELGVARLTGELGNTAVAEEEYDGALALYEQAVAGFRAAGQLSRVAVVTSNMGAVANMQGNYDRGRRLLEEALALQREHDDDEGAAVSLHNLARVDLRTGRVEPAAARLRESLEIVERLNYREVIAHCVEGFAEICTSRGDPVLGATLLGASEALFDDLGVVMLGDELEAYEETVETLRGALGDATFALERAAGRSMPIEEAIAAAFSVAAAATTPGRDATRS